MGTVKSEYKRKYTYIATDMDGNKVFEGRVEFVANMIGTHPSHIRNLAVDNKSIKFQSGYVTISRRLNG